MCSYDRIQALNALNNSLIQDICAAAEAFEKDPSVGALVITGSERAFAGVSKLLVIGTVNVSLVSLSLRG